MKDAKAMIYWSPNKLVLSWKNSLRQHLEGCALMSSPFYKDN
jgi:hypothetical protein